MGDKDEEVKQIASNVVDSLSAIEESFRLAKLELLKRENELFRPLYAKREKFTSAIPHFWSTVLATEDELTDFIGEDEADLLKSCTTFRVEKKLDDPRDFSITMQFSRNAYLENTSCCMTKDFKFSGGRLTSTVVQLDWKSGKNLPELAAKQDRLSFFSLLSFTGTPEEQDEEAHDDDDDDEQDIDRDDPQLLLEDMAMLLVEEVYPHALSYFTDALLPADEPLGNLDKNTDTNTTTTTTNGTCTPALESMSHSFLDLQARMETAQERGAGKSRQLSANAANIEQYAASTSTTLPPTLLQHREESIDAFNELKMVTLNEAQFLHFYTRHIRARRVLEIGCFTGFSALVFCHAGAQEVVTCEIDAQLASFAKLGVHRAGKQDVVRVVTGDAHETIRNRQVVKGAFDLIFIDAEKRGYVEYFKTILELNLLAPEGVVVADNTLRRGIMADMKFPERHRAIETHEQRQKNDLFEEDLHGMKAFNDYIAGLQDYESVMLPVWDGVTLIRHK